MWNEGYTAEVDYISGYYSELSPTRIRLALLSCGIDHSISDAPEYLELGFGQGLSLNINAATSSGRFYGTDFNPGQVANARELAGAMGKPLALLEDSFEELAQRTDLPSFDIIALHGIWSWVSEGARAAIVEIARKSLKPGGALYISYNVTPGWSPGWPLRILLAEHAKREGTGTIIDKVDQAIGFVDSLIGANAAYFAQNPALATRLEGIKKQNKTYVAHEFLNAHWDPMPFSQVADRLSEAKLTFAGSASILENLQGISIPHAALPILQAIKDPIMRETTRDYFINQQFRRDIFVKGPRVISAYDAGKRVEKLRFVLLGEPDNCPSKVSTVIGEADLKAEAYQPVAKALAAAPNGSATIAELMAHKDLTSLNRAQLWEIMLVLTGAGFVAPVATSKTPQEDNAAAKALNTLLMEKAEVNSGVDFLAAPKLGAAISVSRIDQLFMHALQLGEKDPVERVAKILAEHNQTLIIEGETITDPAQTRKELKKMLGELQGKKLDLLKRLGVC